MKKIIAALLIICMLCVAMCACQSKESITADDAVRIVTEDLGTQFNEARSLHVHEGVYNKKPCYNVYFTLGNESMLYVISIDGEILYKGEGAHSH